MNIMYPLTLVIFLVSLFFHTFSATGTAFLYKKSIIAVAAIIFLIGIVVLLISQELAFTGFHIVVLVFFLWYALRNILSFDRHTVRVTLFQAILFLSVILVVFVLSLTPLTDTYLWWIFLFLLTPFIIRVFRFVVFFPQELHTDLLTYQIKELRRKKKKIDIIIFYGKTRMAVFDSTKRILEVKKPTYVSRKGTLTNIRDVLQTIPDEYESIFLVQLPEVRKEVKSISYFLKPTMIIEITQLPTLIAEDISPRVTILINKDFPREDEHIDYKGKVLSISSLHMPATLSLIHTRRVNNRATLFIRYKKNIESFSISLRKLGKSTALYPIFLGCYYKLTAREIQKALSSRL